MELQREETSDVFYPIRNCITKQHGLSSRKDDRTSKCPLGLRMLGLTTQAFILFSDTPYSSCNDVWFWQYLGSLPYATRISCLNEGLASILGALGA